MTENQKVLAEFQYDKEKLISIFALPKWMLDMAKANRMYNATPSSAYDTRILVGLLKEIVDMKAR